MSIFESIANLSLWWVGVIVCALWVGRCLLRRYENVVAKQAAEIFESLAIAGALVFFIIRPFIVQSFFIPSESMVPTLQISDHIMVNKFLYRVSQPKPGDVIVFRSPKNAMPDGIQRDFIKRVVAVPGDVVRITPGRVLVDKGELDHMAVRNELSDITSVDQSSAIKFTRSAVYVDGKAVSRAKLAAELGINISRVHIEPGTVYVNGKARTEPFTAEDTDKPYPIMSGADATPTEWLTKDSEGRTCVKIPKGRLLVMGDNRNNSNDSRFWGLLDRRSVLGKAMFSYWPLGRVGVVR